MCSLGIIINNTVMTLEVTDGNWTYNGDHFVTHINIEPL